MILQAAILIIAAQSGAMADPLELEAPKEATRFDPAEFVVRASEPWFKNPFTDVELTGAFETENGEPFTVRGFADSQDGGVFRLRFCPEKTGNYKWKLQFKAGDVVRNWEGTFRCDPSQRAGPVIADARHPKHFKFAGSGKPFYHMGYTAYHLLDPAKDDAVIQGVIDYCKQNGFNKIRLLLSGYPRDSDNRTSDDNEYGSTNPWQDPNYGSKAGQTNAIPAWLGEPHAYDFARFNVEYWQKVDRAVKRMRDAGIVATCIITIEKQRLHKEYGTLTEAEYRLYRYAVARLAAFDNVWWDLGNEHNEFRDTNWGNTMGTFVTKEDPYHRLLSAHAYADFLYPDAPWSTYIITQQYGNEKEIHDWVLKYRDVPKPYVNEEYGYEGAGLRNQKGVKNAPGHGQSVDWIRRCHWSMAMAGGYATYGDWSDGISYFYMGTPGPGKGPVQLKHLRRFFEELPFSEMKPADERTSAGFCYARSPDCYVFYFPAGGESQIDLKDGRQPLVARWFDPRSGEWQTGPQITPGPAKVTAPDGNDWVLCVRTGQPVP